MNEFERRLLDIADNHVSLVELVKSGGTNTVVEHFGYTSKIGSVAVPLALNVTQTDIIPILSDSWFVMQYVSSCLITHAAPQWFGETGNINLQVTDTSSGEILYSSPFSAGVLTATISRAQTGIPMLLPIPRLIAPNTSIKIEATLVGGADTIDGFWLFFGGSRITAA